MNKIYIKNPNVVFRKIADEFILVPIKQKAIDLKSIYTLNETAAFIWEHLDGKQNLQQIKNKLIEEFDVEPYEAETDIRGIISQFEALGLIEKV